MKAKITKDGVLEIKTANETEYFALIRWKDDWEAMGKPDVSLNFEQDTKRTVINPNSLGDLTTRR